LKTVSRVVPRAIVAGALVLAAAFGAASAGPQDQQKQDIPDAPSASRPPQSFPTVPPPAQPEPPPSRANQAPPGEGGPNPLPSLPSSPVEGGAPPPPPPLKITTVPEGGATAEQTTSNENLYKIVITTNQVMVPVMVKDQAGHLVNGLLPRDFSVYEDGKKQALNFFTADAFAISAAVVIDQGMPDTALQKVNQTFPALEGAFSLYDEVALYTYSSSVSKMTDFATVGKRLTETLNDLKMVTGRNNGVPVMSGPLGPQGPTVNNAPIDQGRVPALSPPKETHALNDAILAAAMDLSKRDRTRRKVIFVVSDGREARSNASYQDVLKVLLTNGILVYGVVVEGSALPVYGRLQRLHLPKSGYFADILPKYANATGGEILDGFSANAIGTAYADALGDARNQYTLGYRAGATPTSSAYRDIEVRVARPDLKVSAKTGYYPLGLGR
jgi:VWFA-related protein